jgi:signal transduction histidine kinase
LCWLLVLTAVVTVATFGLVAYLAARKTAIEATNTRLQSVLSQLVAIAGPSISTQLATLRTTGSNPAVVNAIAHPDDPLPPATLKALRTLQGGTSGNAGVLELLRPDGTVVYTMETGAPPIPRDTSDRPVTIPSDAKFEPFIDRDGAQLFEAVAPIRQRTQTIGLLRVTRSIGNATSRRLLSSLLGERSELLIGNTDGTLWGASGIVHYPIGAAATRTYERNGTRWISAAAPVPDTPWMYSVEMPESVALAPARALFLPFLITGALIAIGSVVVGLRVSRRITTPLADLTAAAEAIALGERNVTLRAVSRQDEIGRLARSFDSMAASVHAVRDRLESEIDARTGELGDAVQGLRKLDEELRRNERFATIGRLSGSVGHELRNPLNVMSTVVFLLDAMPDASPKVKSYASLLHEQIRLSERIISDVLDRARSGAPVRSEVDILALLEAQLVRADIPETVVVVRRFPDAMPTVTLDKDHVGQILWNLINNAVQAMRGSGTLTISVAVVDGRLRIDVRDSGPGIAAADTAKIFQPLFTTKPQGVGLGLSISRAFARSNGGDLTFESTPGQGATFFLDLPIAPLAAGETPAVAQDGAAANKAVNTEYSTGLTK